MKQSGSSQKSEQTNKGNMEHYFNAVKSQDFSRSREDINNWLYKAYIKIKNQKEERKLHKMKHFIQANKLKVVYTVIALIVVVGACNMPVTQTESAGSMLSWTVPIGNSDAIDRIDNLSWLKNAATIDKNENINNGKAEVLYTAVFTNTAEEQIASYRKDLEAIGVTSLKITPINYDVKRPLYSAALHEVFSINIDATGMSDEELQNEVQRKMKEQGIDMKIQFKTGDDGKRNITIINEKSDETNTPKSYEINIDDKNGKEKIKLMQKIADPDKFKGKTDQEIKEMIMKENPGVKFDDIKIIRDGDKVQVKVEVEKTENGPKK